jgi:hypothetical protein
MSNEMQHYNLDFIARSLYMFREALHAKRHKRHLLVKDGIEREMVGQFGLRFQLPRKSQGSFTCRKSATWDRQLYFLFEEKHALDTFARKI